MSDFLFMFSAHDIYIFIGITMGVVVISFLIRSTEEFPYSNSCFNCNNRSCRGCSPLNPQELDTHQKNLKLIACQPDGSLQYIEAIAPEDTENLVN